MTQSSTLASPSFLLLTYTKFPVANWPAIDELLRSASPAPDVASSCYRHTDGSRLIRFTAASRLETLLTALDSSASRALDAKLRPLIGVEFRRQVLELDVAIGSHERLPTTQSLQLVRTELAPTADQSYRAWSRDALYPALTAQPKLTTLEYRTLISTEPGLFHFFGTGETPERLTELLTTPNLSKALTDLSGLGVAPSVATQWTRTS